MNGPEISHLREFIDALAIEVGAKRIEAADTIGGDVLERAGHLEAFGDLAIQQRDGYLNPAACFHVYEASRGATLVPPAFFSVEARCARREAISIETVRLPSFTMREVVVFDHSSAVVAWRDAVANRSLALARQHGIDASLEVASDSFFGSGRGAAVYQRLKELKLELRANGTAGVAIAIASFNVHESHFTERFDISGSDAGTLHSACAAWGLERWADAFEALQRSVR